MKKKQIKKLKEKLWIFLINECNYKKSIEDMWGSYFSLPKTKTKDGKHEIQVEIYLGKLQIVNRIDGHIYNIEKYTFMEMYNILKILKFNDYIKFIYNVNIDKWLKEKKKERIMINQIKHAIDLYNEEEDEMNKWLAARIYDEVLLKGVKKC